MKKMTYMPGRAIMIAILFFTAFSANAQKLANIQENNVLAPGKVDIDGKAAEWNNTFQAYNKNTAISYTVANDEKNLYLVIQSATSANNNKIIRGGITFTVNTAAKKKGGSTVLFPVVAPMSVATLMQKMNGGRRSAGNINTMTPEQIMKRADSVMTAANKEELGKFKEIKVKGFPSITDSLISIYNEHGIKTVATLDEKGLYTYELSIPLETLSLSVTNPKEFTYNIMVNGIEISGMGGGGGFGGGGFGGGGFGGGPGGGGGFGGGGGGGFAGGVTDEMLAMISAADFWGKYTLTKK